MFYQSYLYRYIVYLDHVSIESHGLSVLCIYMYIYNIISLDHFSIESHGKYWYPSHFFRKWHHVAIYPWCNGTFPHWHGHCVEVGGFLFITCQRCGFGQRQKERTGAKYEKKYWYLLQNLILAIYIYIDYIYIYICQNDLDSTPWHPSFEPPYSNPGKVFWWLWSEV